MDEFDIVWEWSDAHSRLQTTKQNGVNVEINQAGEVVVRVDHLRFQQNMILILEHIDNLDIWHRWLSQSSSSDLEGATELFTLTGYRRDELDKIRALLKFSPPSSATDGLFSSATFPEKYTPDCMWFSMSFPDMAPEDSIVFRLRKNKDKIGFVRMGVLQRCCGLCRSATS